MSFKGKLVRLNQLTMEPPGTLKVQAVFVDEQGTVHGLTRAGYQSLESMPPAVQQAFVALVKALEISIYNTHFNGPAPGQAGDRDVKPRNILEQLRDDDSDGSTQQG